MEDHGYGFYKESGEPVTQSEAQEMFNEMLDECYEEIRFGEMSYLPSDVLESTDPIAHRCGVNDYIDALCQDGDRIVYDYKDTDAYAEESDEDKG